MSAAEGLPGVSLETVTGLAGLQTRTDRKYIASPALFDLLVAEPGAALAALEIDGMRSFRYESVYFDTPALDSYRGAAHGRRRRFKVRTRTYLDTGGCALEVKVRGGRGETVKHRLPYDPAHRSRLTDEGLAFLDRHLAPVPEDVGLAPVLVTSYRRTTIVDLAAGTRLTCDTGLMCSSVDGRAVALPDHLLLESKSPGPATAADRFLWRAGCRPVPVSKFGVGMAALDPALPANRWHRTLRRHFSGAPALPYR